MLVSYKWLNEYVDVKDVAPKELADRLSLTGIEVEGLESPEDGLKKIVVGDVKNVFHILIPIICQFARLMSGLRSCLKSSVGHPILKRESKLLLQCLVRGLLEM